MDNIIIPLSNNNHDNNMNDKIINVRNNYVGGCGRQCYTEGNRKV